ncbi:cytochrome c biogenesis protein [Thiovulum sp. ES]|nr:cytochrome c biogenesis protein [Thiovulum sp. ES]
MEEQLVELFQSMPYLVSFLGGFITFISPCVLPLIPAYLSYISGLSYNQISGKEKMSVGERLQIAMASLSFIFGFSLIFVLLGVVVEDTIGDFLKSQEVAYVAGAIIVIFGLHTMKVINISFLNIEAKANFGSTDKQKSLFMKLIAPFVLGLSFALGWTPCVGPILGSILTMSGTQDGGAVLLMSLFALGLAIPFFLSAMLTSYAMGIMGKIKKNFRVIEIVSGILLIIVGIAIAFGSLGEVTGTITDLIETEEEY